MRESRFRELMADEFGAGYAATVIRRHSISTLGATAEELLAGGTSPRAVWEALCDDFDVPEARRFGTDHGPRRGAR